MNNEEFLRKEIKFMSELLREIILVFPETKKHIEEKIIERTNKNKEIEDKLDGVKDKFYRMFR